MSKKKNEKPFDPADLKKPEDLLKFEIATELGLSDKVMEHGWRSLTAKESGRIGGLMTKRKREMKGQEEKHLKLKAMYVRYMSAFNNY